MYVVLGPITAMPLISMDWTLVIYKTKGAAVEQKLVGEMSRFPPGVTT